MTMTKYRLAISLLWGIGFTSLICLLMNLNWFIGMLLIPGGLSAFTVPLLVLRRTPLEQLRRIAGWSIAPVTVAAILACFPSMNPLWPHGMKELARQESDLQTAIPVGASLEQVRGVLNSRKVQFYESTQSSDGIVLQYPNEATMTAQSGDTVLVSRFDTEAFEYPCGYDMQIVLVFGPTHNLKQRYIHRFRMCP
jgi:hypothetical protein